LLAGLQWATEPELGLAFRFGQGGTSHVPKPDAPEARYVFRLAMSLHLRVKLRIEEE